MRDRSRLANQAPTPAQAELAARLSYAGQVGEEITVTGTVTRKEPVLSRRYSAVSTLLEIDCDTSLIIIFTNARWADTTTPGEQVTVTGTIKKLQCWHHIPETVLGRTKRIDQPDRTQPADNPDTDGWPTGTAQVRRRFPDHPNPAAPPLPTPPTNGGTR
jgi:hypothetical protein